MSKLQGYGPICQLLGIKYPIIQAGMVYVSGAKLAAASANAGILGIIGAGSMNLDLLRSQIERAKSLTTGALAVNIPLLYEKVEEQIEISLHAGIRIFFTSAGSPKKYTPYLKEKGAIVVHVTSTPELAVKCQQAGVDAVVAEGFEAGGHNGRDELSTMTLVPQVVDAVKIPVIAAGGIGDGRGIAAALALGAQAVQMGTRFVATQESSAHINFKNAVINAHASDTCLALKKLVPVRLLKNKFFAQVLALEEKCASKQELSELLGKGRARKGMLLGELDEGELEIGQIAAMIKDIPNVQQVVQRLLEQFDRAVLPLTP